MKRATSVLVILFVLFFLLFHTPVIEIFNTVLLVSGIPVLPFYLFVVWVFLIILLFLVSEKFLKDKDNAD